MLEGRKFVASRLSGIKTYWPLFSFVVAIGLALGGQWLLEQRLEPDTRNGVICFVGAIFFFLLPLSKTRPGLFRPLAPSPPKAQSQSWSNLTYLILILGSILIAALLLLAYRGFAGNRFDGGFEFWLAAIVCFLLLFGELPAGTTRPKANWTIIIGLSFITLLAIFFRVYRLNALPPEMTSDHAEKLLDVYDVLNGMRPIYFPRNTGREAFQFYLTAGLIAFTPLSLNHLALKVGTAIFGIITIPAAYWLAKSLYGRPAGLLTAFLLAISQWHVAITRVGLRFPFTAAFAAPALFFLFRALRHNRRNDWLLAGLILGIGLHTYTAIRIVPLLFALLVIANFLADGWQFWRGNTGGERPAALTIGYWRNGFLAATLSFILFWPLLRVMQDDPEIFWYRAYSRAENENMSFSVAWTTFWSNVKNALLMFNYRGDVVPMNTVPESPVLDKVTGALFVLGVAFLLWRLFRYRERRDFFLLLSFFVLLLPSILSLAFPLENPSVVRTGGAIPFVMLIAALPLLAIWRRLGQLPGRASPILAAVLLAGLLIFATTENYRWYFGRYEQNTLQSLWNSTQMGQAVRAYVASGRVDMAHVYHVAFPFWVDTRNIAINAGDITWNNAIVTPADIAALPNDGTPRLFLLFPDDNQAMTILYQTFPAGQLNRYLSHRPGKDFYLFYVP